MTSIYRHRAAEAAFIAMVLLLALAPQAYKLTFPPYEQFSGFFPDDALYYFKTALNARRGFGLSFDGVNLTNGFQPLWMILCVAAAFVTTDEGHFLTLVLSMNLLAVGALSYLVIHQFRRSLGLPLALSLALVLNWQHDCATTIFDGLETPLSLAFLLLVVDRAVRTRWESLTDGVVLGSLLGFAFLARTDIVLALPILAAYFLIREWRTLRSVNNRHVTKAMAMCCGTFAVFAVPYLVWNVESMGMVMPISGAIKALGPAGSDPLRAPALIELLSSAMAVVHLHLFVRWANPLLLIFIAVATAVSVITLPRRSLSALIDQRFTILGALAVVVFVFYVISYGSNARFWHRAPVVLVFYLFLFRSLAVILENTKRFVGRPFVFFVVVVMLLSYVGQTQKYRRLYRERHYHFTAPVDYQDEAARWLRDNTSLDVTIGVFDAGYVGYFAGRRIVNLDGLINGRELYDYYRDGRGVWRYVLDKKIDYLSNYYFGTPAPERSPIAPYLDLVHRIGERSVMHEGKQTIVDWYVWRVARERIPSGLLESGVLDGGIKPRSSD